MVKEISSSEAWQFLEAHPNAQLVDVRTMPEWSFVGVPDLSALHRQANLIEIQSFPTMALNAQFVPMLEKALGDKSAPVLFLCRSGSRSRAAAAHAMQAGYADCYNIMDGFEGDLDENGHRGQRTGWKASRLPWSQR